jgi:hypothetical protein
MSTLRGYIVYVQANGERSGGMGASSEAHFIGEHVRKAHEAVRGEHQLAEYVAGLQIGECARILQESPVTLPVLAALRDECRVEQGERRGFEEVIRVWTEAVLSGVEGG